MVATTDNRPIAVMPTRNTCKGAQPVAERYECENVIERPWMDSGSTFATATRVPVPVLGSTAFALSPCPNAQRAPGQAEHARQHARNTMGTNKSIQKVHYNSTLGSRSFRFPEFLGPHINPFTMQIKTYFLATLRH